MKRNTQTFISGLKQRPKSLLWSLIIPFVILQPQPHHPTYSQEEHRVRKTLAWPWDTVFHYTIRNCTEQLISNSSTVSRKASNLDTKTVNHLINREITAFVVQQLKTEMTGVLPYVCIDIVWLKFTDTASHCAFLYWLHKPFVNQYFLNLRLYNPSLTVWVIKKLFVMPIVALPIGSYVNSFLFQSSVNHLQEY